MTDDEEYLTLSGLQHFAFCKRQWALIFIEQQWAENLRTIDGDLFHTRVHDASQTELRGDLLITRGMGVISRRLGVNGICDVVEFHKDTKGISLFGRDYLWTVYPVEYKKGKPNRFNADELQLCAQALCLEEMLLCQIPEGSLFYGEPRRRTQVLFTADLRERVETMLAEMKALYSRGHTPKVRPTKSCQSCSLNDLCLPKLCKSQSVSDYLREHGGEDEA